MLYTTTENVLKHQEFIVGTARHNFRWLDQKLVQKTAISKMLKILLKTGKFGERRQFIHSRC